jgi:hypothetical protein
LGTEKAWLACLPGVVRAVANLFSFGTKQNRPHIIERRFSNEIDQLRIRSSRTFHSTTMDRGNEKKYGNPTAPERPAAEDDPDDDDDKKPAHDPDYNNLDFDSHMDDEIRELPPPHPEPVLFEPLILIPITHQPLVTELYDGPALFTTPILATDTFTPDPQYPMNDTIITAEEIAFDLRELQVLIQREANRTVYEVDPDPDEDTSVRRVIPMIAGGWGNQFSGQPPKWKCNACWAFNEMTDTQCPSCKAPKNSDHDEIIAEATAAAIEAAAVGAVDISVANEAALAAASAAALIDATDVPMTVPGDDEVEGPNGTKNEQRRKRYREKTFDSQKKKKPRFE